MSESSRLSPTSRIRVIFQIGQLELLRSKQNDPSRREIYALFSKWAECHRPIR
jgi:hypothetical protein